MQIQYLSREVSLEEFEELDYEVFESTSKKYIESIRNDLLKTGVFHSITELFAGNAYFDDLSESVRSTRNRVLVQLFELRVWEDTRDYVDFGKTSGKSHKFYNS